MHFGARANRPGGRRRARSAAASAGRAPCGGHHRPGNGHCVYWPMIELMIGVPLQCEAKRNAKRNAAANPGGVPPVRESTGGVTCGGGALVRSSNRPGTRRVLTDDRIDGRCSSVDADVGLVVCPLCAKAQEVSPAMVVSRLFTGATRMCVPPPPRGTGNRVLTETAFHSQPPGGDASEAGTGRGGAAAIRRRRGEPVRGLAWRL